MPFVKGQSGYYMSGKSLCRVKPYHCRGCGIVLKKRIGTALYCFDCGQERNDFRQKIYMKNYVRKVIGKVSFKETSEKYPLPNGNGSKMRFVGF